MTNIVSTAKAMLGGADASNGAGGVTQLVVTGTWVSADTFTVSISLADGRSQLHGAGALTAVAPTFGLTYKKKNYLLGGGQNLFFSGLNEPTVFNDPNVAGSGFMELGNEYGFSDHALGAAIYQGNLATFARASIQIIQLDPDPANYKVLQTLENIGTVNGASVQGIGDLDVLFCAESGVRSLRVRDSSNNASVVDLGTPIDSLVQARLLSEGSDVMASVVEPISSRYWLSIDDLIYVFSYFPGSGIAAWSTYEPSAGVAPEDVNYTEAEPGVWSVTFEGLEVGRTYRFVRGSKELAASCLFTHNLVNYTDEDVEFVAAGASAVVYLTTEADPGETTATLLETFTPEKFEVFDGIIYARSTAGKIYQYGGDDNATYDGTPCSWETPWLDARAAATSKLGKGADAGFEGGWVLKVGQDPVSAILKEVYRNNVSTYGRGVIPATMKGNHVKIRGETYGETYARFSTFASHFDDGDSR
jgi:hypothetical protein